MEVVGKDWHPTVGMFMGVTHGHEICRKCFPQSEPLPGRGSVWGGDGRVASPSAQLAGPLAGCLQSHWPLGLLFAECHRRLDWLCGSLDTALSCCYWGGNPPVGFLSSLRASQADCRLLVSLCEGSQARPDRLKGETVSRSGEELRARSLYLVAHVSGLGSEW